MQLIYSYFHEVLRVSNGLCPALRIFSTYGNHLFEYLVAPGKERVLDRVALRVIPLGSRLSSCRVRLDEKSRRIVVSPSRPERRLLREDITGLRPVPGLCLAPRV